MTWLEARWGLQLIAEEGPGRRLAEMQDAEDAQFAATTKELGGGK